MADNATFYAKSVTQPSFTVTESEMKFLNHTFYYPGRVQWDKVTITLVDPSTPDATGNLLTILKNSGYNVPGNLGEPGALSTLGKGDSNTAIGAIYIRAVDEVGNTLETWTLNNPFISSIKFNDFAYDQDGLTEVTLEVRYDWASYNIPGARENVGGPLVDRNLFSLGS
jgi:hypothetical protein